MTPRPFTGQIATGGCPPQPVCQHNPHRELIAVKDGKKFAHEEDLRDDGSKADEGKEEWVFKGLFLHGLLSPVAVIFCFIQSRLISSIRMWCPYVLNIKRILML